MQWIVIEAWSPSCFRNTPATPAHHSWRGPFSSMRLFDAADSNTDRDDVIQFESEDAKKEAVGNLVADDEWMGVSMELSEVVRVAVLEDLKKNAREFLGKDDYKMGDISKQLDTKVKEEVAKFRGKDDCKCRVLLLFYRDLSKRNWVGCFSRLVEHPEVSLLNHNAN